jgi:hypothetical protein
MTMQSGSTPLIVAAYKGHTACCEVLLEHGADVRKQDAEENTALDWARSAGHEQVLELLLRYDRVHPFSKVARDCETHRDGRAIRSWIFGEARCMLRHDCAPSARCRAGHVVPVWQGLPTNCRVHRARRAPRDWIMFYLL